MLDGGSRQITLQETRATSSRCALSASLKESQTNANSPVFARSWISAFAYAFDTVHGPGTIGETTKRPLFFAPDPKTIDFSRIGSKPLEVFSCLSPRLGPCLTTPGPSHRKNHIYLTRPVSARQHSTMGPKYNNGLREFFFRGLSLFRSGFQVFDRRIRKSDIYLLGHKTGVCRRQRSLADSSNSHLTAGSFPGSGFVFHLQKSRNSYPTHGGESARVSGNLPSLFAGVSPSSVGRPTGGTCTSGS